MTSGPLYIPSALTITSINNQVHQSSSNIGGDLDLNQTQPSPINVSLPRMIVNASRTMGDSPLFVKFTGVVYAHARVTKIQLSDIISFVPREREQTIMTLVENEVMI